MNALPIAWGAVCAALLAPPLSAQQIEPTDLYDLPEADIIILGETHDNAVHHAHQAIAVGVIGPTALVFEMLEKEQAERATGEARADEASLEAALNWTASGWPAFALYYPIFAAAPRAAIYGGSIDRASVRRAIEVGAAQIFGPDADRFGLETDLSGTERITRQQGQQTAHCNALPDDMLSGMVEAQRLRDAVLARAALTALDELGAPVVIIAGTGHARTDWGVPAVLQAAAPGIDVLSIGQYEGGVANQPPNDLWLVTEAAERDDPCEGFDPD